MGTRRPATPTLEPKDYSKALFMPAHTARKDSAHAINSMRLDANYYHKCYDVCRGRGFTEKQCRSRHVPIDSAITPQNPAEALFEKDVINAISCMVEHGSVKKCQHFTEKLYEMTEWEFQPTTKEVAKSFVYKVIFGIPK
eukprot:Filipodium_phascolosomae@DN4628_c0_g1_i1.p1